MRLLRIINNNVLSSKYFSNINSSAISKLEYPKKYVGKIITFDFEKTSIVGENYFDHSDLCVNGKKGVVISYDASVRCLLIDFFYENNNEDLDYTVLHDGNHNALKRKTGRYFPVETIEIFQSLGLISDNKELEKELLMQQIANKHRIKIKIKH